MKVSKDWLKELVEISSINELVELIPLRTQGGIKEETDSTIELDLKGYNRSDLLSMRGVAYEAAAILDTKAKFEEPQAAEYIWVEKNYPKIETVVEDKDLTPVYCLAKIEGLKVDKSSEEWVKKLNDCGIRSVNNVADVTNLVMLEYGQPTHAFDADKVKGKIDVRLAHEGEELLTLDNKKRQLIRNDLLITDESGPIGLAGVMGGKETEVTDSTTSILLEAAIFDPSTLRKTGTRLGLQSEASKRFYHGLTLKRLLQALNAAIKTYQEMGGELTAITFVQEEPNHLNKIPLSFEKTKQLIGVDLSESEVEDYLKRLNFDLTISEYPGGEKGWVATPPYYRLDVEIEEDVIEEVARMYGYEKITSKVLPGEKPEKVDQKLFEQISTLKKSSVESGLTEIQTYSYFSTKVLNNLGFIEKYRDMLVKVSNPISSETEFLRFTLWPNLLEVATDNLKKNYPTLKIFEIGKVFIPKEGQKPVEKMGFAAVIVDGTNKPLTELFRIINQINNKLDFKLEFKEDSPKGVAVSFFHPKRFISINLNGEQIGGISEIHPRLADKFGIQKRIAVVEFYLPE